MNEKTPLERGAGEVVPSRQSPISAEVGGWRGLLWTSPCTRGVTFHYLFICARVRGYAQEYRANGPLYVFQGCLNKIPQIGWPKQQKFVVTFLEAGSPNSRCRQGCFFLQAVRENVFHALPQLLVFAWQCFMLLGLWMYCPDLCLHLQVASLCVLCQISLFSEDNGHTGLVGPPYFSITSF